MNNETSGSETNVHLISIRKALANGNASVMVGAGFSRNAEGGESLATWRQLSEALSSELAPDRPLGTFSPASASQLAEQYARVYSPTHLEHLIKKCVPDDEVTPGALHRSLLELNWSDVFTTNYDTLLERAADQLLDVSYFAVCSREDIPLSTVLGRRRIVKLHDSFPSHRPFILTEEEYRTYPQRFAPFVNLVRQSLLENVMCLIGFSGDDPNFLHWLGWVRDMLDKHALPVYLFLATEPTLGERKLLEARGVVPVLLPVPEGVARDDYKARYHALFAELAKPLIDAPLDWGQCPRLSLSFDDPPDKAIEALLANVGKVQERRLTYPGWLVAPHAVRVRFSHVGDWIESALCDDRLRKHLMTKPPQVVLVVTEMYCWVQQLLLKPLLDEIAGVGKKSLEAAAHQPLEGLDQPIAQFLRSMGIEDESALLRKKKAAALALLSWARQSHRANDYETLQRWLRSPAHRDAAIEDRLAYESAIWCLQHADRLGARKIVEEWRPSGSDAYMQVLRGSLLAEVSQAALAMPVLLQGIQTLRRQHRSRPGDPALTSKESWACVIANLIQKANDSVLAWDAPRSSPPTGDSGDGRREDYDKRLRILVTRGYSAKEELKAVLADLNAEATIPARGPQRLLGFNVGTIIPPPMIDHRPEPRTKIASSFAWLELVERVGLPPHTKRVVFYGNQMLQAAWWARFADTPERSIGLLLRAARAEALKPLDPTRPPHETGWLTRHNVAVSRLDAATEMTAALVQQVARHLDGSGDVSEAQSRLAFMLEVAGRLVVRVQDETTLVGFGQQILSMHATAAFQAEPSLWSPASFALRKVIEALPSGRQLPLLLQCFGIPAPAAAVRGRTFNEHELQQWLNLHDISSDCSPATDDSILTIWQPVVQQALHQLKAPQSDRHGWAVWRRLHVLRKLKLLDANAEREIGAILWRDGHAGPIPTIPGMKVFAAFNWPAPKRNDISAILKKILRMPLRPFSGGYMLLTPSTQRRSYNIGDATEVLELIRVALDRAAPTLSNHAQFIKVVSDWMDHDVEDLARDLGHSELRRSAAAIVDYLGIMLAKCVEDAGKRTRTKAIDKLIADVDALDSRLQVLPFHRHALNLALIKVGHRTRQRLPDVARSIVDALHAQDSGESLNAFRAALRLLEDDNKSFRSAGRTVFVAVVACAFNGQGAPWSRAMDMLSNMSETAWRRHSDPATLCMLDSLLEALLSRLDYSQPYLTSPTEADAVPHKRFSAFRLASAMIDVAKLDSPAARDWLSKAADDPLPEIRFERFRQPVA